MRSANCKSRSERNFLTSSTIKTLYDREIWGYQIVFHKLWVKFLLQGCNGLVSFIFRSWMVPCTAFQSQYTWSLVYMEIWICSSKLLRDNVVAFEWVLFQVKFLGFFQSTNFPNLSQQCPSRCMIKTKLCYSTIASNYVGPIPFLLNSNGKEIIRSDSYHIREYAEGEVIKL